jgi:hypothetical protein
MKPLVRPPPLTGAQLKGAMTSSSRPKTLQARPRCALCDKPVEEFTEEEGFLDRMVVFVARCHGETERVKIGIEVLHNGGIDFGLAFVPKNQLAAPGVRGLLPAGEK